MGTRHLIYVQHNNEYKVAKYGHWDGLDKNTFEVYQGFNKAPLDSSERFASITSPDSNEGYYQVKFLESFDLDNLPSEEDFIAQLEREKN